VSAIDTGLKLFVADTINFVQTGHAMFDHAKRGSFDKIEFLSAALNRIFVSLVQKT
jgi:hypothetical protein